MQIQFFDWSAIIRMSVQPWRGFVEGSHEKTFRMLGLNPKNPWGNKNSGCNIHGKRLLHISWLDPTEVHLQMEHDLLFLMFLICFFVILPSSSGGTQHAGERQSSRGCIRRENVTEVKISLKPTETNTNGNTDVRWLTLSCVSGITGDKLLCPDFSKAQTPETPSIHVP